MVWRSVGTLPTFNIINAIPETRIIDLLLMSKFEQIHGQQCIILSFLCSRRIPS